MDDIDRACDLGDRRAGVHDMGKEQTMRLIDADRLLTERMKSKYYHLPNGDTAIPIIDIEHAPTIEPMEWIPCSDGLPKKEEATYLICTEDGYMCSCRWTNDMYGFGSNEWSEWGWHIMDKPLYAKVVAWSKMKPWKGTGEVIVDA